MKHVERTAAYWHGTAEELESKASRCDDYGSLESLQLLRDATLTRIFACQLDAAILKDKIDALRGEA